MLSRLRHLQQWFCCRCAHRCTIYRFCLLQRAKCRCYRRNWLLHSCPLRLLRSIHICLSLCIRQQARLLLQRLPDLQPVTPCTEDHWLDAACEVQCAHNWTAHNFIHVAKVISNYCMHEEDSRWLHKCEFLIQTSDLHSIIVCCKSQYWWTVVIDDECAPINCQVIHLFL